MGQVLHGSATTAAAVRRAIQHSEANLRTLEGRYGLNPKTIAKWKTRSSTADRKTGRASLSPRSGSNPGNQTNRGHVADHEEPEPEAFRSGRQFAAWIGLTPKDHSTADKVRLGVITRAGDEALRSVLAVGATVLLGRVNEGRSRDGHRFTAWVQDLLTR